MNQKSNSALVAAVAVLATLIVVILIIAALIFTNVIPFGSSESGQRIEQTSSDRTKSDDDIESEKYTKSSANPTTMYVANVKNAIYLRSEPVEDESNIIDTIPVGSLVVWLENTDTVFSEVSYGGAIGYVKRDYLSAKKPQENTANSGNTTVYKYMYVANVKNSIYLRSTASETSDNIIATIPVGTEVGYIERTNNVFSRINYNGTIGYAKTAYLNDYYNTIHDYLTVCNVKKSIYLRSAPLENPDNIICEIPLGSVVRYLGDANGGFYKISYDGYIGYSKSIYLR